MIKHIHILLALFCSGLVIAQNNIDEKGLKQGGLDNNDKVYLGLNCYKMYIKRFLPSEDRHIKRYLSVDPLQYKMNEK